MRNIEDDSGSVESEYHPNSKVLNSLVNLFVSTILEVLR